MIGGKEGAGMRWRMEFYSERRGTLARYGVEAPTAAEAVRLGRAALVAEYPPARGRRRLSLVERAERAGGQDGGGWVLNRIAKDDAAIS